TRRDEAQSRHADVTILKHRRRETVREIVGDAVEGEKTTPSRRMDLLEKRPSIEGRAVGQDEISGGNKREDLVIAHVGDQQPSGSGPRNRDRLADVRADSKWP